MNNRVRWVKNDNGNVDDSASDAAPTLARSPMTWERASKVLTDGRPDLDADDTNPVPALSRQRMRVDGTEEIDAGDVLEVAESQRSIVAPGATSEVSVDDVLEEVVSAPTSGRQTKTEPPSSRSRKTDPPSSRNRKTEPPSSARLVPQGVPVPHWTDPSLEIPRPAPLPSVPFSALDPRANDPRREKTVVGFLPPRKPVQSRAPWLALGVVVGVVVVAILVMLILPSDGGTATASATSARVPTFHGSGVKHRVERSVGHGPVVPVFSVNALPR